MSIQCMYKNAAIVTEYTQKYTHIYIYTHICTHKNTHIYKHTSTCIYVCACVLMRLQNTIFGRLRNWLPSLETIWLVSNICYSSPHCSLLHDNLHRQYHYMDGASNDKPTAMRYIRTVYNFLYASSSLGSVLLYIVSNPRIAHVYHVSACTELRNNLACFVNNKPTV